MRLAEAFLRIGSSLVGWMIIYAHVLWLAVSARVTCGAEGAELFAVLLGLTPLTLIAAPLVLVSRPLEDVHRMLRWLGAPLMLLLPFCLYAVYRVFQTVYGANTSICGDAEAPVWQLWWVPIQLCITVLVAIAIVLAWRRSPQAP